MNVTLSQKVSPSPQVLFQELAGEAVLLDLASEKYFGLDPVGTRIWHLLVESENLDQVLAVLRKEYSVPAAQLEADLLVLANELAQAGLVEVG